MIQCIKKQSKVPFSLFIFSNYKSALSQRKELKMKNSIKSISIKALSLLFVVSLLASCAVLGGCGNSNDSSSSSEATTAAATQAAEKEILAPPDNVDTSDAVHIEIDVKNYGLIKADLYPKVAPITVENFVKLAKSGFYDGLTFHRIISGFMIQGGDPLGNGTGGSDENIKGEFSNNGFENNLKHVRGVLSMARSAMPDSASSQFFIIHQDSPHLDGDYAAFGKVTEGIEVVDEIAKKVKPSDDNGTVTPSRQPVINSIKVVE